MHYDFTYLIHPFAASITTPAMMPIINVALSYDRKWDSRALRFSLDFNSDVRITASPSIVHTAWHHLEDYIDRDSRFNKYCNVLLQQHFREGYERRPKNFQKEYRELFLEKRMKEERTKQLEVSKEKDKGNNKNKKKIKQLKSTARRNSKDETNQLPIDARLLGERALN